MGGMEKKKKVFLPKMRSLGPKNAAFWLSKMAGFAPKATRMKTGQGRR